MSISRIMYCCTLCADANPEMCGYFTRDNLRVMPDGEWLCESCFDETDQAERGNDNEDEIRVWSDFLQPPEYAPCDRIMADTPK